jgi:hypothetical protein
MLEVGFEPMIPAFEPAKTVHALDSAAAVIGRGAVQSLVNYVPFHVYVPDIRKSQHHVIPVR